YFSCKLISNSPCKAVCGPAPQSKLFYCKQGEYGERRYRCTDIFYGFDCPTGCDYFLGNKLCSRKAYGRCSKTCAVGEFTSRFVYTNMNYTCITACCCSQCEPG
ncbi:hypothetical protein LSH36_417g00000, partial [Paralvinella palmiformis]